MGILDEAIREHLELKRQHGAGDSELRELEDEAFGPPARPGGAPSEAAVAEAEVEPAEPPPPEPVEAAEKPVEDAVEPPSEEVIEPPAEEPAMEHQAVDPGGDDAGTVAVETEEHPPPEPPEGVSQPAEPKEDVSISDQPTELYEFEGEPAGEEPPPAEEPLPVEPASGDVEDEFFSEQSLSDELDQALDAPDTEGGPASETEQEPEPEPFEEAPEPAPEPEEPPAEEPEGGFDTEPEEEDVLEETPEFLQDTPEHDRLWFEQRPPKDFDFDD